MNRQCASGLQACSYVANAIRAGEIDVGIGKYTEVNALIGDFSTECTAQVLTSHKTNQTGAGVESMSNDYASKSQPSRISAEIKAGPGAADCFIPMGITSENVAADFSISRQDQDQFSVDSHEKALKAQALGLFDAEIVPVRVQQKVTIKDDNGQDKQVTREVLISKDEGPRVGSTVEKLGKLKAVFKKDGSTTAGNASQVSDGAAAVVLMRRSKAMELGCPILGRWCASRVVGVPPRIMGVGPAYAIPAVLKDVGLGMDDVDIYEINEAFASQALYCARTLGINPAKINPKGGAIALGHVRRALRVYATVSFLDNDRSHIVFFHIATWNDRSPPDRHSDAPAEAHQPVDRRRLHVHGRRHGKDLKAFKQLYYSEE